MKLDTLMLKISIEEKGLQLWFQQEAMNKMGIIIDVSHLSDKGFWDVASKSKSPFQHLILMLEL